MSDCRCGHETYHCRFGFHHVVVTLAQECSGVSHDLPPAVSEVA